MVRTQNSRKRLMLALSIAIITILSGNNIVSFYLGDMLGATSIYNTKVKLQIVSLSSQSIKLIILGQSRKT